MKKIYDIKNRMEKVILDSKRITIVCSIIFLFIIGFSYVGNMNHKTTNDSYVKSFESYSSVGVDRQKLWNKMKVTRATITERKTGTEFDSGTVSNMDGIDVSDKDEYVKTVDDVHYVVELNIDPNTNMSGVSENDEFEGGVIKFRASIPRGPNGEDYLHFIEEPWMKNVSITAGGSSISGELVVPKTINLAGAIQQLSFTLRATFERGVMPEGPTFEFWMEGNAPDNEAGHTSTEKSFIIKDSAMKISGKEAQINYRIKDGYVKRIGMRNGVLGQYWSIGVYAEPEDLEKGLILKQYDSIVSNIDLEYYYKPTTISTTWTKATVGSQMYNDTIAKAEVVAVNRNGDVNDKAYPYKHSNYSSPYAGFSRNSKNFYGRDLKYDSGNVTATINSGKLSVTNSNVDLSYFELFTYNYNDSNRLGFFLFNATEHPGNPGDSFAILEYNLYYYFDAVEIFIPYADTNTDYDYQIKLKNTNATMKKTDTNETKNVTGGYSLTASYSEQSGEVLTGKIKISEYTDGYESTYVDDEGIPFGANYYLFSGFSAKQATHYGEERLINIDTGIYDLVGFYKYEDNGTNVMPTDFTIKYGVYKNDPVNGLDGTGTKTATAEVNSADKDNFYWYDSIDAAKACTDLKSSGVVASGSSCTATSIHINNPSYEGGELLTKVIFKIRNKESLLPRFETGEILVGSVRQKIRLYNDPAKAVSKATDYYYSNAENSYIPRTFTDDYELIDEGTPYYAGTSTIAIGSDSYAATTLLDYNKKVSSNFNVMDEIFYFNSTPIIYNKPGLGIAKDDFLLVALIPKEFKFNVDSATVKPTHIYDDVGTIYNGREVYAVVWELKNCDTTNNLLGTCDNIDSSVESINAVLDISPFVENNSAYSIQVGFATKYGIKNYEYTFRNNGNPVKYKYDWSISKSFYVSNLSGAYARTKSSNDVVLRNEIFTLDNSIYNNSQKDLTNVKTIQMLPKNGDVYGSKINGNYTIKVTKADNNQKVYYSTLDETSNGITYDINGKMTIENVNLATDSRWTLVNIGGTIPATAKAIAIATPSISIATSSTLTYEVIPSNNDIGNVYAFKSFTSSNNLSSSVATNLVSVNVINRTISGVVFEDKDRNNLYSGSSELVTGAVVKLYDSTDKLIDTYTTASDGKYIFESLQRNNYYVTYTIDNNHEYVKKSAGTAANSSIMNPTGKSDLLTGLNVVSDGSSVAVDNVNIGFRKKESTLTVNHYLDGTTTKLAQTETIKIYWGDTYTTSISNKISSDYELVSIPNNATGTVSGDVIVNYYYKLKSSVLTVHHYIVGTTTELSPTETKNVFFGDKYTTSASSTIPAEYELVGSPANANGTISSSSVVVNYYYKLKTATLTVHHYLENTTTELATTETSTLNYTDSYTTKPSDKLSTNYELVKTPDNATGTINGDVTVNYYYRIKTAVLTVRHYKEGTTEELAQTETTNVFWGDNYTTKASDKVSTNYELVKTPANANGIIAGDTVVTYYYKLKSATLTVHYYKEGTTEELAKTETKSLHWGDTYTTASSPDISVNFELVSTPANASGIIAGDVTVNYYYRLKGTTLTVHHYIEGTTTELAPSENKAVNWGDSYTTKASDKVSLNYELVSTPANASGVISSNNVIVNYYYKLKTATLTVHHYLENTTTELAPTETSTLKYTDNYTTKVSDKVSLNYELVKTPDNATGVIGGNVTVNYYYKLKSATLTIHYYIKDTTTELAPTEVKNVFWGENYTTTSSSKVSTDYELVATPANASGTISGDVIVNYYYKLKESNLVVKHLENGTNKVLSSEVKEVVYYGETYTTKEASDIPSNYELLTKPNNYTGIVSSPNIEVIYYYQKKDSSLTSSITKTGPSEITKVDEEVNYKIEYKADVKDYIGDSTITIVDTLPYKIDTSKSSLDGGIYDETNQTITWTISWDSINSYTGSSSKTITKNIKIVYLGILPTERLMVNSVKGNIKLDNNERNIENQSSTDIKVPGKIIVHHYLEGTTDQVFDDVIADGLVGDAYISSPLEKDGYVLVKEPTDKNHIYTKEDQEVTYEYKRLSFNIVTKVEGSGGVITGDESVYYGDDSTKDYIVIKPDKGFEVTQIFIKGEEIDVETCRKGCVLGNFKNVIEDKEIVVTFVKVEVNPDTAITISITFIIGLITMLGSILYIRKGYKKEVKI